VFYFLILGALQNHNDVLVMTTMMMMFDRVEMMGLKQQFM